MTYFPIGYNAKLSQAYKEVFNTEAGKIVLKDLLKIGRYNEPTYVQGDSTATAFNEGMRRIALRIVSYMETDPIAIAKLTQKLKHEEDNDY